LFVTSIHLKAFRNLVDQEINLAPGMNVLVGDNGQGKTNFLEAFYVLSSLRSFRQTSVRRLVQHGSTSAEVRGVVMKHGAPLRLRVVIEPGGRRMWFGERPVHSLPEYLSVLKAVAFTPDDLIMVKGPPILRRRFLDRAAFLFEPLHLLAVREFSTALRSRNRLVREKIQPDPMLLDSYTETLAKSGVAVSAGRLKAMQRISLKATALLSELFGIQSVVNISFCPGWSMEGGDEVQNLSSQLHRAQHSEKKGRIAIVGPQSDDFDVTFSEASIRQFGSQGQQRAVALALLLAVVEELLKEGGEPPAILLDDFSSELDEQRRAMLFAKVLSLGSQVLVTTTNESLLQGLIIGSTRRFIVTSGCVREVVPGGHS
jgi:recF protein